MAVEGPGAARQEATMTSLPNVEDLPIVERGFDEDRVRDAFEAFRRHLVQLQAQLRVLQAAGRTAAVDPTGHAVRMDSLHLIREAAEFADVIERDAQRASAAQFQRTEQDVRQRLQALQEQEGDVHRFRDESERQRNEILTAARNEARQVVAEASREATKELREAEARGAKLLEQARHQATELTNATRAEVEQTLEWARGQASAVITRAQQGAEQLLSAAGLGEAAATEVAQTIVKSAQASAQGTRPSEPQAVEPQPSGPQSVPPAPAEPQSAEDAAPEESAPDADGEPADSDAGDDDQAG